jgi:hypothetical protein
MNRGQAARNTLRTYIAGALAEASGTPGRVSNANENHAGRIADAIVALIDLKVAGQDTEPYERDSPTPPPPAPAVLPRADDDPNPLTMQF